jgi:hypothetical protein
VLVAIHPFRLPRFSAVLLRGFARLPRLPACILRLFAGFSFQPLGFSCGIFFSGRSLFLGFLANLRAHPCQKGGDIFTQVLHQVPPIAGLDGLRRAKGRSRGVIGSAIPANHGNLRVSSQPGRNSFYGAIGENLDHAMSVQVDDDRSIGSPSSKGEIIQPDFRERLGWGKRSRSLKAQDGWRWSFQAKLRCQAGCYLRATRKPQEAQGLAEPFGHLCPGLHQVWKPFRENRTATGCIVAREAAYREVKLDSTSTARHIRNSALILAVDEIWSVSTQGTTGGRHRWSNLDDELMGFFDDLFNDQALSECKQGGFFHWIAPHKKYDALWTTFSEKYTNLLPSKQTGGVHQSWRSSISLPKLEIDP